MTVACKEEVAALQQAQAKLLTLSSDANGAKDTALDLVQAAGSFRLPLMRLSFRLVPVKPTVFSWCCSRKHDRGNDTERADEGAASGTGAQDTEAGERLLRKGCKGYILN
eukprot:scaffold4993_cov211-Prasinococcus_capsulatus_cf.AAC.5